MVKLTLRDKESAQEAVRRFRKLVERSGIKKEMRVLRQLVQPWQDRTSVKELDERLAHV